MLTAMTGTRPDGNPWPGYYGEIEVSEQEARQLVGGQNAEYVDEPELDRGWDVLKTPGLDYENKLKRADGEDQEEDAEPVPAIPLLHPAEDDDDFDRDEPEAVTRPVKRPATVDNKASWIEYAVFRGMSSTEAENMTKAQLVAKYGK